MTDQQNIQTVFRHPEWRRLYDALAPILAEDMALSYDHLGKLAGIDIRSPKGRSQFQRFRVEVLKTLNLYLENQRNEGYRVVFAKEHVASSRKQVERGRRRVRYAGEILDHTHFDRLTADQNRIHADAMVRTARIFGAIEKERYPLRKLERAQERLPSPGLS